MNGQTLIVLAIIAAAAFYLVRRLARNAQGHPDGACDKCGDGGMSQSDAKEGRMASARDIPPSPPNKVP
jgi:hypothetical protein